MFAWSQDNMADRFLYKETWRLKHKQYCIGNFVMKFTLQKWRQPLCHAHTHKHTHSLLLKASGYEMWKSEPRAENFKYILTFGKGFIVLFLITVKSDISGASREVQIC
jgi:hypothetical protein